MAREPERIAHDGTELQRMLTDGIGGMIQTFGGALQTFAPIELGQAPVTLRGASRLTKIVLERPLVLTQECAFYNLVFIGDFDLVDASFGGATKFYNCTFRSATGTPARSGGTGDGAKGFPKGRGLIFNATANHDQSYGVRLYDCRFENLVKGIDVQHQAMEPGSVNALTVSNGVFTGCRYGVWGDRVGHFQMQGGIFQLCDWAVTLWGSNAILRDIHWERNAWDVVNWQSSLDLWMDGCDANPIKTKDNGTNTRVTNSVHHWNMARYTRVPALTEEAVSLETTKL